MNELDQKLEAIRKLLENSQLDALVLRRVSSFAWATCGASSYVNTASELGTATIVITQDSRYLITNRIEAPRLSKEEKLEEQGWTFIVDDWYSEQTSLSKLIVGKRVGADFSSKDFVDVSIDIARLRSRLLLPEQERFRQLGKICAEAMNAAIHKITPGQSEHEIAAILAYETESRGAWPIVDLVAVDDRVYDYRHPLPTDKRLSKYAMLVLCGRKWGLVCSITRLIHFGKLPEDLAIKQSAVANVDAALIHHTRPNTRLSDVFIHAIHAYEQNGFADEWKLHHQGGIAGYESREFFGTPTSQEIVYEGQAYAWNPSITGVKSEDTILVGADNNEVLTDITDWPKIEVDIDGHKVHRPAILEIS